MHCGVLATRRLPVCARTRACLSWRVLACVHEYETCDMGSAAVAQVIRKFAGDDLCLAAVKRRLPTNTNRPLACFKRSTPAHTHHSLATIP